MGFLMKCLDTTKSLKINKKKNIGTVLMVVEGENYEFEILKRIFCQILRYNYIERKRYKTVFHNYDEFVMKGNENSRVIVINAKNSNISSIDKDDEYLNNMYMMLYNDYGIEVNKTRIYFIWDRDPKSNTDEKIVRDLISKMGNSLDNDEEMNGLLLLSYPAVESYVISNFENHISRMEIGRLKEHVREKGYNVKNINQSTIKSAVVLMHKLFKSFGVKDYSVDNFSQTALKLFDKEENCYKACGKYKLLSLMSIIFIDLGIIVEK